MRRLLFLLSSCAILCAQKKPFDVNALLELKRIGDPQISPDGRWVAFTVQTVDVAANEKPQQVWIMPLNGGEPRQITHDGKRAWEWPITAGGMASAHNKYPRGETEQQADRTPAE